MLDKLVKIANVLDQKGLHKEADMIDSVLQEVALKKKAEEKVSGQSIIAGWGPQEYKWIFETVLDALGSWALEAKMQNDGTAIITKNTGDKCLLSPEVIKKGVEYLYSDEAGYDIKNLEDLRLNDQSTFANRAAVLGIFLS